MQLTAQDIRNRWLQPSLLTAAVVVLSLAGALLAAQLGLVAIPLAASLLLTVLVLVVGTRLWFGALAILLTGYMFSSRGFAGIGFYPVYVGEIVMALGLLTLILTPFSPKIRFQGIRRFLTIDFLLLALFFGWSVLQTVPYFAEYQFDTLRDAMIFGYAVFAVLVLALVPRAWVVRFLNYYARLIPFALLWFPIFYFVSRFDLVPIYFPGSQFPLLYTKGSDLGVHLSGMGAFLLLSLDRSYFPRWLTWVLWILWLVDVLIFGSFGRAVLLCAALAIGVVFIARPFRSRWDRPLLLGIIVLSVMLLTGTYSSLRIDVGLAREISAEQLVDNVISIFGSSDNEGAGLEGTKQWRLLWWAAIQDYTFNGPYFWNGKGYGVNLANSDGFQVEEDESLRSPHNGHMTILARSGVPGYLLWIGFLAAFGFRLLRFGIANMGRRPFESRVVFWILGYLVAFVVMTSFDVFLEGPMGGIWFWVMIGVAAVYMTDDPQQTAVPAVTEER